MTLRQPFIRITPQKIMFVKTRTEYNLYHFLNEPSIQTKELHSVQNKTISISISKKLEKNSAKAVMTCLTSANVTIKNHISISPKTLFENPYVSLLGLLFILVTTTSIQAIKIREKQLDHERIRTSLADTIKMEEKSTQN
jgi:hypothetical protein